MFSTFIIDGTHPILFWSFVGIAVVLQAISKSGFGGAAGILSVPLMLLVMPVPYVLASLLPILILCDFNAIYHHWHNKDWKTVLAIYIPSVAGILIGAWVWWRLGREGIQAYEVTIKRFVGVIAVFFSMYVASKEVAMDWVSRYRPGKVAGWCAGITAGFCSTMTHTAGPIFSLYIFSQHLGKTLFVGTVAWTLTLVNLTKLPFFCAAGLIRGDMLLFDLTLVWLIPFGSYLGKWMHHGISEKLFNRVICVLALLAGIQLLLNVNVVLYLMKGLM